MDVIPEQALRRESQVDMHTGRGGAANVHHVSGHASGTITSGPSGQTTPPVGQQNHRLERGGEGNVQQSGSKHEGVLDTMKQIFSNKKYGLRWK
ncbi:hypothetical protein MMC34_001242 [Xylographa carneopallida]|nr:hypothetical protein [Xylographa carneopallida]